ncbi:MAG: hypothetical protein J6K32_08225 [Clostridia bacterium]|nr:hypothetical protein [Clostridia bacterium]
MRMILIGMAFAALVMAAIALTLKSFVWTIEAIAWIAEWATGAREALSDKGGNE